MHTRWWALCATLLVAAPVSAQQSAVVAVAANFSRSAEALAAQYAKDSGAIVTFTSGSTGKLYAQIEHGAPFDAFLSADLERPQQLEEKGLAVAGSRFTYAFGRLVLWSNDPALKGKDCRKALSNIEFRHLAIANPKTAPYGVAAVSVLENLKLPLHKLGVLVVQGENIAQTMQFVATNNAQLGFVALSQLKGPEAIEGTCRWDVPADQHGPIEQQAVLLKRGESNPAASGFLKFLKSDAARELIRQDGYDVAP